MSEYELRIKNDLYERRLKSTLIEQHMRVFDYSKHTIKDEYAEYINCPVCDSAKHELFFEKDLFKFVKCQDCEMVFLNPRLNVKATYEFYNSHWTSVYNERKFLEVSSSTEMDDRINSRNLELIDQHRGEPAKKGKLLELGFGNGFFLRTAKKSGYDVYGIDVDSSNYERAKKEFGNKVFNTDLFETKLESGKFDVIYMRDVFEHVPNPKQILKELNRVAKSGAVILIEVPNIDALIYKIVKQRHVCVFGFAHLNYWSPKQLKKIFEATGFDTLEVSHESLDFTLADIAAYFLNVPFTTIDPVKSGKLSKMFFWSLYQVASRPPLKFVDRKLLPKIADGLGRGSEIKIIGRKN